jgi:hypothetical protein
MFKKILDKLKGFFLPPQLDDVQITLEGTFATLDNQEVARREKNQEALALANLNLQRDAYQKNLILLHRSIMVAIFAALVAIILGIIAVTSKSDVTVKVYEQKTINTC